MNRNFPAHNLCFFSHYPLDARAPAGRYICLRHDHPGARAAAYRAVCVTITSGAAKGTGVDGYPRRIASREIFIGCFSGVVRNVTIDNLADAAA
jgi:hypothetical protein